jgi:hypothetical protein
VQDDRDPLGVLAQDGERVLLRGAGVDHHRETDPPRQLDLGLEGTPLVRTRGPVAVVVEPGLADRPRLRVRSGTLDASQVAVAEAARLVRVPPHYRHDLVVCAGGRERKVDRRGIGSDGGEPGDARRPGPRDELGVRRLAGVEVAVGVDHG